MAGRLGAYVAAGARHVARPIGTVDLPAARDRLEQLAELAPLLRRR